ncbi:MAG TPA: tetratricopeptide repeat protein [Gemmataceae bacterium]|nr:tetratricopeptide repeat protein [Gemmataceae bacterium]
MISAFCLLPITLCLAGCQHLHQPAPRAVVSVGEPDDRPKVTAGGAADVQVAIGRSLEKRGETEQAMVAYLEAVKRDPHRADAYLRLGILCDYQGKCKESAKYYRKALKESPGNPDIFCDMGYSLYLQHRWAEAEINMRQALALSHNHRRAHMDLGLLLARTDRVGEALVEFRTARCSVADANINVAYALTLDRRWDAARYHYQRALVAEPSSEAAKDGLSDLKLLMAKAQHESRPATPSSRAIELATFRNEARRADRAQLSSGSLTFPAP